MRIGTPLVQEVETWTTQHDPGVPWWSWALGLGLLGLLALLVVRALRNRLSYSVAYTIGEEEKGRIHAALVEAERRTVGEIVPVVLGRSDAYPAADLWCAILLALAAYCCAWALPLGLAPFGLLVVALLAGATGWLLSRSLPELRRSFVAPWRMREMAEEQAVQEFFGLGLHRTEALTGVLLFVSLFERRVIVMGDEGIDAKLDAQAWRDLDELVLDAARDGELGAGIEHAVRRMGEILAEEFPWTEGDRNEVPDRVVLREA